MNQKRKKTCGSKISAFLFMFAVLYGCGFSDISQRTKLKITVSVFPLKEFAQAVCGERGEVKLLLPPGAEIHTWRPRPSDIITIAKSDVFIHIGTELEPWLQDVLKGINSPNLHVLRASDSVLPSERVEHQTEVAHQEHQNEQDHKHTHGSLDPHIWLDFAIDQRIIDNIIALFSQIDPAYQQLFELNGTAYKKKLGECDLKYRNELAQCKKRTFVLGGHAAFGYLARRYNLNQISLYGINPDSRPTPRQLVQVVELAKEHQIEVIYFEFYVSGDLAKVIAKEVGADTVVLNPAANLTVEQTKANVSFLEIMDKNLTRLKKGLSCD